MIKPGAEHTSSIGRALAALERHPWRSFTVIYLILAMVLIAVNLDTTPLRRFDGAFYATEARDVYQGHGRITKHILPLQLLGDPEYHPPLQIITYTNKPLFSWLMAASYHIFGATDQVALWTCFFFYLLCGPLLFYFVNRRWGFWPGLIAVFMFLLYPSAIDASTAGWTDMLLAALVLSATFMVILFSPGWIWTSGLVMAGLCLCRPNGLVIAAVLCLAVFIRVIRVREWTLLRRFGHLTLCALPILLSLAYLFHFNYQHYGSPLRFYDSNGWERLEMTGLLPNPDKFNGYCFYYSLPDDIMERYWADPSIAWGQFTRKVEKSIKLIKDSLFSNPFQLLFLLLGILWIPRWRSDPAFRALGLVTAGGFVLQYLAAYSQLPFARLYTWMLPSLTVMSAVAVYDLWRLLAKTPGRPLAGGSLKLVLAGLLAFTVAWGAVGELDRLNKREDFLKKFRVLNVLRGEMLKKYTDENAMIVVNYHESWLAWYGDRHVVRVPFRFQDFLGVVKKIHAPEYFLMGLVKIHRKHAEEKAQDPKTFFPEIGPYAKLITIKKTEIYYVSLFSIDIKKLRGDFAEQITGLPN